MSRRALRAEVRRLQAENDVLRELLDFSQFLGNPGADFRDLLLSADTSTPSGRLVYQVLETLMAYQSALVRERQREGIEAAKTRGVYRGSARRLSPDQVASARSDIQSGIPKTVVARKFGIARQTLYNALAYSSPTAEGET